MTLREERKIELSPYEALPSMLERAARHGQVIQYGSSVEGRPLQAVRVGSEGPAVAVTAGIHGVEYIGVQVALEVLARGPLPGLQLWVCPVLNPDGYARTWAQGGRGTLRDLRRNARGVDLNRNFPLPYGARPSRLKIAGSDDPADATYRGPSPLSEPETAALAALLQEVRPIGSANLHSFMGTLICARVWRPREWFAYASLCRAFRQGQQNPGYIRLGSPILDVFTGELEDWQHHVTSTWATCVECFSVAESVSQHVIAPSVFWRFNPREPSTVIQRDAAGVRSLLSATAELGRPPAREGASRTLPTWRADARRRPRFRQPESE